MTEAAIQRAFFEIVARFAGDRVLIWSCPNEGNRGKVQTAQLRAMGLEPGAADVNAIWSRGQQLGGVLIEFKTAKGRQSDNQKKFEARVRLAGWPYVVCRTWEEAWVALEYHGAPLDKVLRAGRLVTPEEAWF